MGVEGVEGDDWAGEVEWWVESVGDVGFVRVGGERMGGGSTESLRQLDWTRSELWWRRSKNRPSMRREGKLTLAVDDNSSRRTSGVDGGWDVVAQ